MFYSLRTYRFFIKRILSTLDSLIWRLRIEVFLHAYLLEFEALFVSIWSTSLVGLPTLSTLTLDKLEFKACFHLFGILFKEIQIFCFFWGVWLSNLSYMVFWDVVLNLIHLWYKGRGRKLVTHGYSRGSRSLRSLFVDFKRRLD